ncbi:glycosyltransferase 87 family protein [Allokutzneria sp. A3M-2-11 16]|uniref:glycosyltransferase 87 family protein n=1 Tax=Allokutzneria sp. A3M-2-11 16 TaxID=2962043 RepID=UPI0020B8DBC9|nr:glycosyltransferase 87 family protein [Allokutzneria sp. A3M-2-11 16]MCP3797662.1 glycosyltransferase 87 family protein [Allokutzneria sp. A3M-2-11 16]
MSPVPPKPLAWVSRNAVWIAVVTVPAFIAISVLHWAVTGFVIMSDFLDLTVYEAGARALVEGSPLYEAKIAGGMFSYTYPPFSTLLFAPMVLGPLWLWKLLVFPVNTALLACAVWLSLRIMGYAPDRDLRRLTLGLTALLFWVEPVSWTMHLGQINLVLLVILLFGLHKRTDVWLGLAVGLAAGIKITPAIFVIYFLVTRRYKAALVAVGTFLATVAISLAVTPGNALRYWSGTFLQAERVGEVASPMNQSLNGLLARLFTMDEPPTVLWLGFALLAVLAGFSLAVLAQRRGEMLLAFTLVGMTGAVVSPISWSHHWVWFVPLAIVAAHWWRSSRVHIAVLSLLAVVTFSWPMHFFTGHRMDIPALGVIGAPEWGGLGNVYTNVYVFLFGATLLWVWRRLGTRGGAPLQVVEP